MMLVVIKEWVIIVSIQLSSLILFLIIQYAYQKRKTRKILLTLNSIEHDFIENLDIEVSNWASFSIAKCDLAIMENQLLVLPYSVLFLKKFKSYFKVFILNNSPETNAILSDVTIYKIESITPSFRGFTMKMIGSNNTMKISAPKITIIHLMESLQKNNLL